MDDYEDIYITPPASKVTVYAPKQQWISVKDGLPDEDVEVLVADELNKVRIGFFMSLCDEESCWITSGDYIIKPSHWMPLPQPPVKNE